MNSSNLKYSEEFLYDMYNINVYNNNNDDIDQHVDNNDIIIYEKLNSYEIKIFMLNLKFLQKNNIGTVSYLLIKDKGINCPAIYLEINDRIYKFILESENFSLEEFKEFCENFGIIIM